MPVSDSLVFTDTGLPVVYIKTFSGKEVASKEVYEEATIEIRDGEGNIDIPMQIMEIHGRGNSSWNILWKKRGYTIKLNKKSEVLGMPKDKKWVLIANYRDKTLLCSLVAVRKVVCTQMDTALQTGGGCNKWYASWYFSIGRTGENIKG